MNTNDKMQPTSSASMAAEYLQTLIDGMDLSSIPIQKSELKALKRLLTASAIVPPVVQAPIAYVNSDDLDNMLDDRTAEIQSNKSGWRGTPLYAAPIVATVPSGWKLVPDQLTDAMKFAAHSSLEGGYTNGQLPVMYQAMLNAAPSPTEQASDRSYHDAYRGARDDLFIWKKRALKAEAELLAEQETNQRLIDAFREENSPTFMGEPAIDNKEAKIKHVYSFDGIALDAATDIMRMVGGPVLIGGDVQLKAQIQCTIIEALKSATPRR